MIMKLMCAGCECFANPTRGNGWLNGVKKGRPACSFVSSITLALSGARFTAAGEVVAAGCFDICIETVLDWITERADRTRDVMNTGLLRRGP